MSVRLSALCYMHALETGRPIANGVAFESALKKCRLDYSVDSLGRIDAFIDALRSKRAPERSVFLAHGASQNLLLMLAFYAGEVVGRSLNTAPDWRNWDEMLVLDPGLQVLTAGFHSSIACRFPGSINSDTFFTPLVPLVARLFQEKSGKSLRASAQALIPAQYHAAPAAAAPLPALAPQQPQGWNLKLAPERRAALALTAPDWLAGDRLAYLFDNESILLQHGRIVWAALVQADPALQTGGQLGAGAGLVVYDPSGRIPPEHLAQVGQRLAALRGRTLSNPSLQRLATTLANDSERVFDLDVPMEVLAYPLKISTTYFEQIHMPGLVLSERVFPVLISDKAPGAVLFLPSEFWPARLRATWLKQEAPATDAGADELYRQGMAAAHDAPKAFALLQKAATLNHAASLTALGKMYEDGVGTAVELNMAMSYYARAAQADDAAGQYQLGLIHMRIDGPSPDLVSARNWFARAAEQGHVEARVLLAELDAVAEPDAPPSLLERVRGLFG